MRKQHLLFEGYAFIEKSVRNGGDSGRVFVPKAWAGKKVIVILTEPPGDNSE